jgi:ribose-phosphate pyrophosphokinase
MQNLVLLNGNATIPLAKSVSSLLDQNSASNLLISRFADGEIRVELECNVRGKDVYILQSISRSPTNSVNDSLMEALITADACRRASANSITLVAPYYGYSRQERKEKPRTPITAKLTADLIQSSGITRVVSMELHAGAIQGFFNIPFDHLFAKKIFADHLTDIDIVVSPDAGGASRARSLAKELNCGLAIIDKRRDKPNSSEVMHVLGDIAGKNCVIYDDMCDTGGSLVKAAESLLNQGAKSVKAAVTHALFSKDALLKILNSPLQEMIVTDTIDFRYATGFDEVASNSRFSILSSAPLISEAIKRIHTKQSVSSLF